MVYEFKHELKAEKEIGDMLVKVALSLKGNVSERQQSGPTERVVVSKDKLQRTVEVKFWDTLTLKFKPTVSEKMLETARENLKNPSPAGAEKFFKDFLKGLVEFESSLGKFEVLPGVVAEIAPGLQLDAAPVFVKLKGTWKDTLNLPQPADFSFGVEGAASFGLSKQGWGKLIRTGKDAVQQFLQRAGPAAARTYAWLVAAGVLEAAAIALAAIVGTVLLIAFTAWVTRNARHRGTLRGIAEWYINAYVGTLFDTIKGEVRANFYLPGMAIAEAPRLTQEAWDSGKHDAFADACHAVQTLYQDADYLVLRNEEILRRHRMRLIAAAGSSEMAKHHLRAALREKVQTQLGSPY